jgi:anti-sigma factor RsiW
VPERDAARREIEKLLPFFVNGSLDDDEVALVEQALERDESLRAERAFLEGLREAVRGGSEAASAGEIGLARLRRSVRAEKRRTFAARAWRPALAVAAAAVLMLQTVALLERPDEAAHLAGGARADLQVAFAPDASADQIERLLREAGASIVGGPGAAGIYRLELDNEPASEEEWDRALEPFESRPDLVAHVARD